MATFAGIATSNSDFSILVDVLGYIDANLPGSMLVATLDDPNQDLTVFAPTNDAFGALASDLGFGGDTSEARELSDQALSLSPYDQHAGLWVRAKAMAQLGGGKGGPKSAGL